MRPAPTSSSRATASSTSVLAVQIISWTWDIGGNGDLYMPYDPSKLYQIMQRRAGPLAPAQAGSSGPAARQAERQRHRLARIAGAVDARAAQAMLRLDAP